MGDWQPIETAPKHPVGGNVAAPRVLLFVPPYGLFAGFWEYGVHHDGWSIPALLNKEAAPTHWMPLPDPPRIDQALATKESDK